MAQCGHDEAREVLIAGGKLLVDIRGKVQEQHAGHHGAATDGVFQDLSKDLVATLHHHARLGAACLDRQRHRS